MTFGGLDRRISVLKVIRCFWCVTAWLGRSSDCRRVVTIDDFLSVLFKALLIRFVILQIPKFPNKIDLFQFVLFSPLNLNHRRVKYILIYTVACILFAVSVLK